MPTRVSQEEVEQLRRTAGVRRWQVRGPFANVYGKGFALGGYFENGVSVGTHPLDIEGLKSLE